MVALIGAAVSVFGAIAGWWIAVDVGKQLETKKAELAKDVAANATALQLASQRQLEVFKLAAESAETAMRCLRDWEASLERDVTAVDSRRWDDAESMSERAESHRQTAQRTGLFLPPDLDAPYETAWLRLKAAAGSVGRHFCLSQQNAPPGNDLREFLAEAIRDRTNDLRLAREAVEAFGVATREWKAKEWGSVKGGNGGDGK
ncbi:MAG: hypothetical protein HS104_12580 [Polyangiaceae bacterium]|nr:hypothetical protein [Polyangiaceae bacterium]